MVSSVSNQKISAFSFKSGGEMTNILTKPHNGDLKTFAGDFFKQVHDANKGGRAEKYVAKDRKFLDAIAQFLTGDEVCAAIAISGSEVFVATNKGTHDKEAISWQTTMTIINKKPDNTALRVGYTCILKSRGKKYEKKIGPFDYYLKASEQKAVLQDPNAELNFIFLKSEFPALPDNKMELTLEVTRELDKLFFSRLVTLDKGNSIPLQIPVITCLGPLKRRVAKILNHLSFISNIILRKRPYLPKNVKPAVKKLCTIH